MYEELSRIAPTVAYRTGWGGATWQDTARVIGRAVGREAALEQRISEVEGRVGAIAAALPGLAGRTLRSVYYHDTGQFAVDTNPTGRPRGCSASSAW